jgi:hypothetical protein
VPVTLFPAPVEVETPDCVVVIDDTDPWFESVSYAVAVLVEVSPVRVTVPTAAVRVYAPVTLFPVVGVVSVPLLTVVIDDTDP